jgi:hypothetical protein
LIDVQIRTDKGRKQAAGGENRKMKIFEEGC